MFIHNKIRNLGLHKILGEIPHALGYCETLMELYGFNYNYFLSRNMGFGLTVVKIDVWKTID